MADLDKFLLRWFTHENGQRMRVECAVVDSGGTHTEQVYRYARPRLNRRVFAIKGSSVTGKPLVGRPSAHNRYHAQLFPLCVDTGKDSVMSRLQIPSLGPGFVHLPDWVDDEYLAQLTAEKAVRKYVKGRGAVREWVKLRERAAWCSPARGTRTRTTRSTRRSRGLRSRGGGAAGPVVGEARAARPGGCRAMTYGRTAAAWRAPLGAPRAMDALQADWMRGKALEQWPGRSTLAGAG